MKCFFIIFGTLTLALTAFGEDISNPIEDYIALCSLPKGSIIYRLDARFGNIAKPVALITSKDTPEDVAAIQNETHGHYNPNIKSFTVYIPNANGTGYIRSKGLELDGVIGLGVSVNVDIAHCYIGKIDQVEQWGLVTIQTDPQWHGNPAALYIYAFTLEKDRVKRTLLGKCDPDREKSAVYDQYLSDSKRTKIELREVTP